MTTWLLHVDCQRRFPMYPANSMYQVANFGRGSASHKDLEQLPVDWEYVKIYHCKSMLHLEILQNRTKNILSCRSCIWSELLCSGVTFSHFVPGEFVNSHLLSSLRFFHFMDTSDASFSKSFFSFGQFFVKPGLLSSWFFIPMIFTQSAYSVFAHHPNPDSGWRVATLSAES